MNAKTTAEPASIYPALVRVTRAIAADGIGKTRDNKQQGYKFRGVDEVMNAFAPLLAKEGIFIRPHFTDRTVAERATKQGGTLFSVSVAGSFDFVAEDGSSITVGPFYGEAMDSGDKATNKAMATAFKYAMFQTFCVPLEGVTGGDADATTHPEIAHPTRVSPTDGAWEAMEADEQAFLLKIAAQVRALIESGDIQAAHDHIVSQKLTPEEKIALWTRFDSKQRSALKKEQAKSAAPQLAAIAGDGQ